jgi:hypothetical protein
VRSSAAASGSTSGSSNSSSQRVIPNLVLLLDVDDPGSAAAGLCEVRWAGRPAGWAA